MVPVVQRDHPSSVHSPHDRISRQVLQSLKFVLRGGQGFEAEGSDIPPWEAHTPPVGLRGSQLANRASALVAAAGIPGSTHCDSEIAAHLIQVTETARWLEWQDWAYPVLSEPFDAHSLWDCLLNRWTEERVSAMCPA
jgi:hypothetical protein